jgi:hypothetical protein
MLNMTIGRVKGCKTGRENRMQPVSKRPGGRKKQDGACKQDFWCCKGPKPSENVLDSVCKLELL